MANAKIQEVLAALEAAAARKKYHAIDFFRPYPKQEEFFALGATKRERLLMAGNQLGKTYAGAVEATYHLTGEYSKYRGPNGERWSGRTFQKPVKGWVAGEGALLVRNGPQTLLCGAPGVEGSLGTGLIPRDRFKDKPSLSRGVTDAFDTIQVEHRTNGIVDGISTLGFKSYEQGREKFQSETLDFIWEDEEPPLEIHTEILARITATGGFVYMTFTPLKGRSQVVIRYLDEPSPDRAVVTMTIDDAAHIPASERQKIIDGYPAHEREARARGVPMLGSGRIFLTPESAITEAPILEIPAYWRKLWAIDFGIGHPFAAVLGLWDMDNDVIHIHHALRVADGLPINHAAAMKPIGAAVPVAWPQDGTQRDKGSGEALSALYRKQGLLMCPGHATWEDGGISTEAGLVEMDDRMKSGRLKVAAHLSDWFEEYRFYHRKDGQIVRLKDDLMSATRVFVMAKRFARAVNLGGFAARRRPNEVAEGIDFDPFN